MPQPQSQAFLWPFQHLGHTWKTKGSTLVTEGEGNCAGHHQLTVLDTSCEGALSYKWHLQLPFNT